MATREFLDDLSNMKGDHLRTGVQQIPTCYASFTACLRQCARIIRRVLAETGVDNSEELRASPFSFRSLKILSFEHKPDPVDPGPGER